MFSLCSVLICGCADSEKAPKSSSGGPLHSFSIIPAFVQAGEGMGITFSVCTIFCSVLFPFYCYECCRCIAVMKNRYDSSPVFIIFHFCQLFPARHSLLMTLDATHKLMPFKRLKQTSISTVGRVRSFSVESSQFSNKNWPNSEFRMITPNHIRFVAMICSRRLIALFDRQEASNYCISSSLSQGCCSTMELSARLSTQCQLFPA